MSSNTGLLSEAHVMNTYGTRSVMFVRGAGVRLYDAEDREYLDFLSGLGVNNLGHCHPAIAAAVSRQVETLIHCCNLYLIEPQVRLADTLCAHSFADRAFFCNSGAEAIEGAMKLARLRAFLDGKKERTGFIAMDCSFHGRTLGAVSITGPERVREGFYPVIPGVKFARYNDLAHVRELLDDTICAIVVEPVIGEGGVIPATQEFLTGLRELCDQHGIALVFDEIQCGLGRVGRNFAYEHYGVTPDIMTLAKALAGGLPIGAVLARGAYADAFQPGRHGSTFGGNPVSAAAALAYCEQLFDGNLARQAADTGTYLMEQLRAATRGLTIVEEIRGLGLMIGIRLSIEGANIVKQAQARGLLINCTAGKIIRLLPPLIAGRDDCDQAVAIIKDCLTEAAAG